jgi:hypothetical protein
VLHGKVCSGNILDEYTPFFSPNSSSSLRRTRNILTLAYSNRCKYTLLRTSVYQYPHIMFGAVRRCPATLARNLASVSTRALRTPLSHNSSILRIPLQSARLQNVSFAGFHSSATRWQQEAQQSIEEDGPVTEFKELATRGLVHPNLINTITNQMKLTTMTDVQTRTINEALSGVDM